MIYKEKLEKYKKKLLSPKEMKEVETDIEKAKVLGEYLLQRREKELEAGQNGVIDEAEAQNAESFEKYVKKSIRRAYLKISLGICAVVVAVALFLQFALSPLLDAWYYNPTEYVEIPVDGGNAAIRYSKMALDYRIYAQLSLPCKNEADVNAFPQGFGNYTFIISPMVSYGTTESEGTAGQIRKGKMELYNAEYLQGVSPNYFLCYGRKTANEDSGRDYKEQLEEETEKVFTDQDGTEYQEQTWYMNSLEAARKNIEALNENQTYMAYVSFRRDLDFTRMNRLLEEILENSVNFIAQPWITFRNDESNTFPFGVSGYNYRNVLLQSMPAEYNEKYPYLTFCDMEEADRAADEEEMYRDEKIMTQHLISMCDYLADEPEFVKMINHCRRMPDEGYFKNYSIYLREHGFSSYGFVCLTTKADMLKMLENEAIAAIVPRNWH